MKVILISVFVAVASAARLENTYLPPNSAKTAGGSGSFLGAPFGGQAGFGRLGAGSPFAGAPSHAAAPSGLYGAPAGGPASAYSAHPGPEAGAQIKSFSNNNDGTAYQYSYETSNNIAVQEHGQARVPGPEGNAIAAQGSFQYSAPDGQQFQITYTADENGFQPQGAHLPTPPPIPEAILKSLQQNAAEEARHGGQGYPSGGPAQGGQGYPSGGPGAGFPTSANQPSFSPQSGYRY